MTREDIIRMAREAGVYTAHTELTLMAGLERFAALVADAEAKRMHAEGMVTVGHMRQQIAAERNKVAHTLNCVCGAVWDVSPDGVEEMVHAPNPPQRKPLTHPQIHEFDWPDGVSFEDILLFVRAIEAAHDIKGQE